MAILKPSNISPNNSTLDSKKQIVLSWKNLGDRQYYYQVVIYNNDSNTLVINTNKVSSLNTFYLIPLGTLSNGISYKYQITVWNQNNQSAISNWIIFKCSSSPVANFTNVSQGEEILNSSYLFQGTYSQKEDVLIRSWIMILYDERDTVIIATGENFDNNIEYEFSGLNNDTDYKIELQVRSQDGLLGTTGKINLHVRYEVPSNTIALSSENVQGKGSIRLQWKVIQIIGQILNGNINFKDGEYIDLTKGSVIFNDGLPKFKPFNLKLWLKWKDLKNNVINKTVSTCIGNITVSRRDGSTELLRLHSPIGDIWLEYIYDNDTEGRFHVWKNFYNEICHIQTDLIDLNNDDTVYIGISYDGLVCDLYAKKVV